MKYKYVFFYGLPRTRSKFYQKLLNNYYNGGIVHETHLLTHWSIPYLFRYWLCRVGALTPEQVEEFLLSNAKGGFWNAENHEFSAAKLPLNKLASTNPRSVSAIEVMKHIFRAVDEAHAPAFFGARHFSNSLAIRLVDSEFERSAHVILSRDFWDILGSKKAWEVKRGLGPFSGLAAFLKLLPLWALTKAAVCFFGGRENVLVLHHSSADSADAPLRDLLDFIGLEFVADYSTQVGVVDSSFDSKTGKAF